MIGPGSGGRKRPASPFRSTRYKGAFMAGIGVPASLTTTRGLHVLAGRRCSWASVAACHAAPTGQRPAAIARALPFWQQRGMSE